MVEYGGWVTLGRQMMAEYGDRVTLGDSSPKPPKKWRLDESLG